LDKNKQSEKEKPSIHKQPPGPGDISQNVTDGPTQPILKLFPRTKFNDKFRQFNSSWYKLYPSWLEYSVLNDGAFCFVCRHFSVNPSQVFTSVGFKNWKRALEKESGFKQHETSSEHRNCHLKWINYSQVKSNPRISVASQINEAHLALVKENREYLGIVIGGSRGHRENEQSSNRGNFLELLKLFSKYNPIIKKKLDEDLPQNAKYTSPQIQNEILYICSKMILDQISAEVNQATCFAVVCDETKDISKTEQISVVLRYYLKGTIYERFIGYKAAKDLNAQALLTYLKELLIRCKIDLQNCVAQTYDGANVMSGRLNGVQKLFRDEVLKAVYVHCFNHRINLITVDICKSLAHGKTFFDLLEAVYVFISGSAVHSKFIETQVLLNPKRKPIELKKMENCKLFVFVSKPVFVTVTLL
jgi:hypothetical protein